MIEDQNLLRLKGMTIRDHIPTVSIGMPVYNAERYIREAIISLLEQTYTDFELIVSDNASTDMTAEICQYYVERDKRVRYICQDHNIGAMGNFQFVLSEAQGEYFMWAASDDRRSKTFIEQAVAVLEVDEGCGLVFSNYIERDLESGKEKNHQVSPSNSEFSMINYIIRTLNMCPSLIYGLYRKEKIVKLELASIDFADVHFISQLALGTRIRVLDGYLYIAGTSGVRKPYSMTHRKINRKSFLLKQYALLKQHFFFPITQCLFLIVLFLMAYNRIRLWRY